MVMVCERVPPKTVALNRLSHPAKTAFIDSQTDACWDFVEKIMGGDEWHSKILRRGGS
jgi:hypothetical protein